MKTVTQNNCWKLSQW